MKFIIAFATVMLAGFATAQVSTQAPSSSNLVLLQLLEKRGDALLAHVKKTIEDNKAANAHLLSALEEQSKKVESIVAELKKGVADHASGRQIHHIHVLEEELFFLENRVAEEVYALEHAKTTPPKGETLAQIVARAEKLVKDAKDAVVKHPQAKEVGEINSAVIVVEALVKALQAKPAAAPAELLKEEQELARQEKSLQQLIEKAAARKP